MNRQASMNRQAIRLVMKRAYSLVAPQAFPIDDDTGRVILHAPFGTAFPVAVSDAKKVLFDVYQDLKRFCEVTFKIEKVKNVTIKGEPLVEVVADLEYEGGDAIDLNGFLLSSVRRHVKQTHDFFE